MSYIPQRESRDEGGSALQRGRARTQQILTRRKHREVRAGISLPYGTRRKGCPSRRLYRSSIASPTFRLLPRWRLSPSETIYHASPSASNEGFDSVNSRARGFQQGEKWARSRFECRSVVDGRSGVRKLATAPMTSTISAAITLRRISWQAACFNGDRVYSEICRSAKKEAGVRN